MIQTKSKLFYNVFIFMLIVNFFTGVIGRAQEINSIETEGSVSFTGIYEPIGKPDPAPPENNDNPPVNEIENPEGSLPQTNDSVHEWLSWLGVLIIMILYFIRRKQKKIKRK